MKPNAQELWNSFREILRDASFFPSSPPQRSVEDTLQTIKALTLDIPPGDLRIIDQELLNQRINLLSPDYLEKLAELRRQVGTYDLSNDELKVQEIERSAILRPVEFMSFPYAEVRAALLCRFGSTSSSRCLRDIYDLDTSIVVKTEVVYAVNARLARREVQDDKTERENLVSFVEEIIDLGFYHGVNIEPARAGLDIFRGRNDVKLPAPIQGIKTSYWPNGNLDGLTEQERFGVVRLYGDSMTAPELVRYIADERNLELIAELLQHLEHNWDLGIVPESSEYPPARNKLSRQIRDVLLRKLGLSELPPDVRDDLLRVAPQDEEPNAYRLMRRLAVRALSEIGRT